MTNDWIIPHKINYLDEPKKYLVIRMDMVQPIWEYTLMIKQQSLIKVMTYHSTSVDDNTWFKRVNILSCIHLRIILFCFICKSVNVYIHRI